MNRENFIVRMHLEAVNRFREHYEMGAAQRRRPVRVLQL